MSYNFAFVCNKQDMLLEVDKSEKVYSLHFNLCKPNEVNQESLLSFKIYELIEKINPALIEEIKILNIISDNEINVLFKFINIAKEIGIKQKYMVLKIIKNIENNTIMTFKSKSIVLTSDEINTYNLQKFDKLDCHFANLLITTNNNNIKFPLFI